MLSLEMKTRDRILHTSLALFNEEGEASQSAVDIANALNISPGNLYYHFKGKDAIIRSLYDRFETEMRILLRGSENGVSTIEDKWIYLYILLEEIYDFRFFYRDLTGILKRYPDLARRFHALQQEKYGATLRILTDLSNGAVLKLDPAMKAVLSHQLLQNLNFWLASEVIRRSPTEGTLLIHKTVFQMMCLIIPYMGADGIKTLAELVEYYQSAPRL